MHVHESPCVLGTCPPEASSIRTSSYPVYGVLASCAKAIDGVLVLPAGQDATDFLQWLSSLVAEALRASQQHDSLKRAVRELRTSLEDKFALAAIQVRACPLACMLAHC